MFKLSDYFRVYRDEAGEGDKPGGAGEPPAKTYTQEEVDAITSGLKSNNEKLLSEKKEAKRLADEREAASKAAALEIAKKSGELETFEKGLRADYDSKLAEKDKVLQARGERILSSEKRAIVSGLTSMLIDESAADIIGMMVKTEFDGDDVVTKFVGADGSVITTDPEQFKKYLAEHKAFSHLIKADASTGGGANGNKSTTGGAGGDAIDKRLAAKYGKRG